MLRASATFSGEMPILEMREATFARGGSVVAAPLTLELEEGARAARAFATPREAALAAMLACGVAKTTAGSVFIGGFDPHIQPTQCKRIAGYVPHEAVPPACGTFEQYIAYRAALWSLDGEQAIAHATRLLNDLRDLHEALAYPLVGALIASPRLLVLDRPQPVYAQRILAMAGKCAVFSTHASALDAAAYA